MILSVSVDISPLNVGQHAAARAEADEHNKHNSLTTELLVGTLLSVEYYSYCAEIRGCPWSGQVMHNFVSMQPLQKCLPGDYGSFY